MKRALPIVLGPALVALVLALAASGATDATPAPSTPADPVVGTSRSRGAVEGNDPRAPRGPDGAPVEDRIAEMREALELPSAPQRAAEIEAHLRSARAPAEREAGFEMLLASAPPEVVWETLGDLFRTGSTPVAQMALDRMEALNPSLLLSEMADVLTSRVPAERQRMAVEALHRTAASIPLARPLAASTLAYPGLQNEDASVREAALAALIEIGTPVVAPRLREYADEESDPELRDLALAAAESSETSR